MTDVARKGTLGHLQKWHSRSAAASLNALADLERHFLTSYVPRKMSLLALRKLLEQNKVILQSDEPNLIYTHSMLTNVINLYRNCLYSTILEGQQSHQMVVSRCYRICNIHHFMILFYQCMWLDWILKKGYDLQIHIIIWIHKGTPTEKTQYASIHYGNTPDITSIFSETTKNVSLFLS
jgi:hypothetical protein